MAGLLPAIRAGQETRTPGRSPSTRRPRSQSSRSRGDAIAKKAEDGDVAAAKLILHYTLGKPTTSVDPDQVDVDEWQKLQKSALPPQEMQVVLNGVPASLATRLTNIAWPCYVDL